MENPARGVESFSMNPTLDQAIQAVTSAEATYNADSASVVNIEAQIATATSPLAAAQSTVATDVTAYNSALDVLIATATAAKIPVVAPVAPVVPVAPVA